MPTPIQLRRNGTAASTPSSLLHGEVALNYADGKLFWKDASNVIQSFTFQAYALSSHTHGNITNAGAIGSTSGLPVITTTSGVLTTGTFSTSAGTFCEGNDARLSDTRTPTDGSVTTAKIANDAVTYAKLQNVSATDRILGRSSVGSGDVEEISCGSFGRSLIGSADAAAARTTLSVQPTASPAFTGAATFDNTGNVVPLTVTNAGTANSFVVNDASGDTTPFVIDASGNVGIGNSAPAAKLDLGTGIGVKAFTYKDAGANGGIGTDLTGNNYELSLFAGGTADTHGRISFGRRRVDTGTYVEHVAITAGGQLLVTAGSASSPGVAVSGDSDTGMYSPGADQLAFSTNQTERMFIDASGNIRINGAAAATSAVGCIHIKNGTAPTANITDGVVLFAADVSSSSELRVRDEAGNTTTLSPHSFPLIPDGPSEPMAWAYYSERDGRRINVDMLRVVRLLEQLTGEKLVYEG